MEIGKAFVTYVILYANTLTRIQCFPVGFIKGLRGELREDCVGVFCKMGGCTMFFFRFFFNNVSCGRQRDRKHTVDCLRNITDSQESQHNQHFLMMVTINFVGVDVVGVGCTDSRDKIGLQLPQNWCPDRGTQIAAAAAVVA